MLVNEEKGLLAGIWQGQDQVREKLGKLGKFSEDRGKTIEELFYGQD